MINRFKEWLLDKPKETRLLIYFGLYFIYWFLMCVLFDFIIFKEEHAIGHYLLFGLWMSICWLAFNKWNLIKSVFSKEDKK
jgi:hypothetical protein